MVPVRRWYVRSAIVGLYALTMFALPGCGTGNSLKLEPVCGTVTYQGKPLDHGNVVFNPTGSTTGPQAIGSIGSDGSFEMKVATRTGVPMGKYIVTIHSRKKLSLEQQQDMVVPESLIPKKYGKVNESGLVIDVQEGDNVYPIILD